MMGGCDEEMFLAFFFRFPLPHDQVILYQPSLHPTAATENHTYKTQS